MDLSHPIFLGLDLPGLVTAPVMLVMFAFAVWFGATRCSIGIDAEEQARRMDESRRS
jgi:hypothetical protein